MPNRLELTDDEWETFYRLLRLNQRVYVRLVEKCRYFLRGILLILRSGGQWWLLPASLGKWNSVFKRFSRWRERVKLT
jgi:transposase